MTKKEGMYRFGIGFTDLQVSNLQNKRVIGFKVGEKMMQIESHH